MAAQAGGEPDVWSEVASLLESLGQHQQLSAAAPRPDVQQSLSDPCELPPARFGPYQPVRLLGRGGMGAVYLARRADGQFEQTVALKIMAPHLAGAEFLGRFQMERQLLASLTHPNITRLLDGGMSSSGEPYLVMEYVEGQTLDRHCDERKLDIQGRLRLFLGVCEAVDYAHRNLILHRDLKPSNVLVTPEGVVKLLDFGTASLIYENRELTAPHARMVTARYASPEQLQGKRTTQASDIFSLGVILYELLTGAWPFGNPDSVIGELERAVHDVTPVFPSTAVTAEASERRGLPSNRLRRLLNGDLSAIALKALESDPSRRYGSVRQLADDIERSVNGLPVQARPQTAIYRASKFVRRRWLPILSMAFVAAVLVAATVVSVNQARIARAEARKAGKVSQFLSDMLASAGRYNFDPQKFTVAQMLDSAAPQLETAWKDDPLVEATLRTSLGTSYSAVQRHDLARVQLEKARTTFHALGNQMEEANALTWLAADAGDAGLPDEAVKYYRTALTLLNGLGKDASPVVVFRAKRNLAAILSATLNRDLDEAGKLFSEAIQLAQRNTSIPRPELALAKTEQGAMLLNLGRTAEAENAFRESIEIFRRENFTGVGTAQTYYELVILKSRSGDFPAAKEFARQYYEARLRNLGPNHARTAEASILWARFRAETGETKEAVAQVLEAIPVARVGLPHLSTTLWSSLTGVSHVLNAAGHFAEAEPYAREEIAIVDNAHFQEVDARRAQSLFELAKALRGQDKDREAVATFTRAGKIYEQLGPNWAKSVERTRKALDEAQARLKARAP